MKTYSEMLQYDSYEDRVHYLQLHGVVAGITFGSMRYLNQHFYTSKEWRDLRRYIIVRDSGCDLAIPGLDIFSKAILHHIEPITELDILEHSSALMDPENLVCVTKYTHDLIHYSDSSSVRPIIVERFPNDTCPWK